MQLLKILDTSSNCHEPPVSTAIYIDEVVHAIIDNIMNVISDSYS